MIVVGLGAECNKSVIILNYQLSFINYQYIMKKILPDLIAILAFIILSFAYFFPADIEGRILFQHDSRYTDISSLFRSQLSQFHPDFFKMQTGYFLIQMFRQTIYIYIIFFIEQFDLSHRM